MIRIPLTSFLFFSVGTFLAVSSTLLIGAVILCYLGGIQLLNALAPHFPPRLARIIRWTHAMTFECFAFLGVLLLRLVPQRKSRPSGKGQPILLVHGYVNSGSVWTLQKKKLEALGLGPIYTINLGHPFRSIRTYAEKIQAEAKMIAEETGRKDLILIGHSMGGVVSCWYATQLAPPGTVTDVITIASPLGGTPVARIGWGVNAREMECNSPLLQELKTAMSQKKGIRFHHIATQSDQLVVPGASAALTDNLHFIFEDIGHASLLYSNRVAKQIAEWLSK